MLLHSLIEFSPEKHFLKFNPKSFLAIYDSRPACSWRFKYVN